MRYSGNSKGSFGNRSHRSVRSFQASGIQRKLVGAQLDATVPKRLDKWLIDKPPVISAKPSVEGSEATYNKATNWLSITFGGVPSAEVRSELKSQGFRYEPYSKRWRASFTTYREDTLKKMAGKVEAINIPVNYAAKAEHAANQAAKHEANADEIYARKQKLQERMSDEPIHVGHHSERHHRADIDRLGNLLTKSVEEHKIAEKYQDRAERYGQKATGESPDLIYRRIKKLEADKRIMERRLADPYYTKNPADKEHFTRYLNHYNARLEVEREKYKASGGIATDNQQFKPGDIVLTRHGLGKIATISKKTARIRLDSDVGIYTNRKQESLMQVDEIKQKLTEEQIQKYKNALKEANKTSYIF